MDLFKRVLGGSEPDNPTTADPVEAFDRAKALAGETGRRRVVLLRPNLSLLALACPDANSISESVVQQMESIVPSTVKRNIAVVTDTHSAPPGADAEVGSTAWTTVGKDLPFFGILNGLGYIGHTVWIFDASADLTIACRNADLLIIDDAVSDGISESSIDAARAVMRTGSVLIHERASYRLRPMPAMGKKIVSWDVLFEEARTRTKQRDRHQIVLVRTDQTLLGLSCIPRASMTAEHLAQAHRIVPEGQPRNIAVIASTELPADPADHSPPAVAQLRAAGKAIPFFGLLLNLASAGNPTWIFDASREMIVPGCRNADLLFIDSALAPKIPANALNEAAGLMRSANVAVYDRNSRKIGLLRSLGGSMEKLVFRD